ncbi:hypothetical protein HPB48_001224 [Haemaphysalis longicornis]|uniref:Uncharacterized protein n=1 Tax=Haemaphysalis longicornis TaxID=44386 RepID=A0A9J6FIN2_HAELO|nr:hypothetical protein HPB48_001224 [Haemaphysalis longicornis]
MVIQWRYDARKNKLEPINYFLLLAENARLHTKVLGGTSGTYVGVTSLSMNYFDHTLFVMGSEGGGVLEGSLALSKPIAVVDSHVPADRTYNCPVVARFPPHRGHCLDVHSSPFERNLFASAGMDREVKVCSLLQCGGRLAFYDVRNTTTTVAELTPDVKNCTGTSLEFCPRRTLSEGIATETRQAGPKRCEVLEHPHRLRSRTRFQKALAAEHPTSHHQHRHVAGSSRATVAGGFCSMTTTKRRKRLRHRPSDVPRASRCGPCRWRTLLPFRGSRRLPAQDLAGWTAAVSGLAVRLPSAYRHYDRREISAPMAAFPSLRGWSLRLSRIPCGSSKAGNCAGHRHGCRRPTSLTSQCSCSEDRNRWSGGWSDCEPGCPNDQSCAPAGLLRRIGVRAAC